MTRENAEMIFDAIKDENSSDFYFNPIGVDNIIPKTVDEVLKFMQRESDWTADNGVALYLFQNNKFIGYRRLFFFDGATRTLQMATVWLVRSAWGHGFVRETSAEIERIAFENLGANRIVWQCSKDNVCSANSIKLSGFHLDGIARQGGVYPDGKLYDNMMWSKLRSEYVTK